MMTPELVWEEIWPTVEGLIQAVLAEDETAVPPALHPKGPAARMYELFGHYVFDLLLKTVLGRGSLSVTRAIEAENGKAVYLELVWPEPKAADNGYTAADLVSVKMQKYRKQWLLFDVNPAAVDLPLTEARAAGILANSKVLTGEDGLPREAWILPVALYGGALQINLRPEGMRDEVERLFLPGMQARAYGILSLLGAHRLWRDFRAAEKRPLPAGQEAIWAAAVEFIANEQALREQTQAAVGKFYGVGLTAILPKITHLKNMLKIEGLDERYTALQREQVVLNEK